MNITEELKIELLNTLKMKKLFGIKYLNQVNLTQYKPIEVDLPDNLVKLNEYVLNCSLCNLSKVKDSITFAKGNLESRIFIVTLNNNCFLEKDLFILEKNFKDILKISINDIYMTNILKCNVNKSNINLDNEVSKCLPYLEHQVDLIKPNLIITFGIAFNYLIDKSKVLTDVSGSLFNFRGAKLVPLLGMDFVNKNPSYKETMYRDIVKIKNIMDEK